MPMNDVLKTLASEQQKAEIPEIRPGDTVAVSVRVEPTATDATEWRPAPIEVSVPNTGDSVDYPPGTPVCAYLPPHAIRVLARPDPNGSGPPQ